MAMGRRSGRTAIFGGVVLSLLCAGAPAQTFTSGITSGTISNSAVTEASGIAASRFNPNVLWTHNDSGNPAQIFAFTSTGATLVILDNVAHLFAGNENDRVHVTAFVNALYALCNEHGCAIVLVAHPNKAGDDYSGSTAWLNAVRSHIVIRRPEGAIDPDERELVSPKANYARAGQRLCHRGRRQRNVGH